VRQSVIALIPARKGSKGFPRKNLAVLGGKTLIARAIEESMAASVFDEIIVSSDDEEILQISRLYGITAAERSTEFSGNTISSDKVISNVIKVCQIEPSTVIAYLQPTSPLRTSIHIKEALRVFMDGSCDAVISVRSVAASWYKILQLNDDGYVVGAVSADAPFLNRQSVPPIFLPNGAIYIFRVDRFVENRQKIPRGVITPYIMSENDSIDVDCLEDLTTAEKSLSEQ
jgi:CMP-N-acetylneuraminic acid synthetase